MDDAAKAARRKEIEANVAIARQAQDKKAELLKAARTGLSREEIVEVRGEWASLVSLPPPHIYTCRKYLLQPPKTLVQLVRRTCPAIHIARVDTDLILFPAHSTAEAERCSNFRRLER